MSALGDVIYEAACQQIDNNGYFDRVCAEVILETPEMLAIRDGLRALDEYGGPGYLEYLDLPTPVLAWVRK